MRIFDSAAAELQRGINLVEASAGTGKTYAISMLVLRFITEQQIPIDRILIVTYTKAATEELKERIRSRIREARDILLERVQPPDDDTLGRWVEANSDKKDLFVRLIDLALLDIDSAAIYTIHGFCQRMLQEHSLESGQLFDVELVPDVSTTRLEVVYDFWRKQLYQRHPRHCALLTSRYDTPEALLSSVNNSSLGVVRVEPVTPSIHEAAADFDRAYDDMARWFPAHRDDLHGHFIRAFEENRFRPVFVGNFESWWSDLENYFSAKVEKPPEGLKSLNRLNLASQLDGRRLRGEKKKLDFLADWPLPEKEITTLNRAIGGLVLAFRAKLFTLLQVEVNRRLRNKGTISFNDLILRLADALKGENGDQFAEILAKRYLVGLIDEFQDTDLTQYHILSTIFSPQNHYLYLIGDPKQAIYTFRGADIFSYFKAREAADFRLTLDKNYRSHPGLVEAVNTLFSSHPKPFLFDELTYHRVDGARDRFHLEDRELNRLSTVVFCQLEPNEGKNPRWSSGKATDEILGAIIREISALLSTKKSPVLCKDVGKRSLLAKDICVLVRDNKQAQKYRSGFAQAGIPAVMTGRLSVFDSMECSQIILLMQTLCSPSDVQRLKNVLSLDWFGFRGRQLYRLFHDDSRFDQYINRFHSYSQQWHNQGFWSMLNSLLKKEKVFEHLAERTLPQRRLTNILHLMDLIQSVETREGLGPDQLLLWLKNKQERQAGTNETELRLESDEQAVHIVTMHSAKGLEYPVVFCPFLWYRFNRLKNERELVSCHTDQRELVVDLGSADFEDRKERAINEQMAEELRLCYVALTRASLRCYVMWADVRSYGPVADSMDSSLGYLLFPNGQCSFDEQQSRITEFCRRTESEYRLIFKDEIREILFAPSEEHQGLSLSAKQRSDRSLRHDYRMSSYTALASLTLHHPDELRMALIEDSAGEDEERVLELPSGPRFGNVIHALLEKASFKKISARDDLSSQIKYECDRYGVVVDYQDVAKLLHRIVTTPLFDPHFEQTEVEGPLLAGLDEDSLLKEMGFYFRLSKTGTSRINEILGDESFYSPLSHRTMEGYLTGYIDLIFRFQNRFFILDYKTNWLGDLYKDYGHGQMSDCIRSHNYGLQYWIYTLVLHRYLSRWHPGYLFERHFGGVFYLFVRGMNRERGANGIFYTRPDPDVLHRLGECIGGISHA